jgi:cobalt-zinc-cadmium efflux system outer membrane protein
VRAARANIAAASARRLSAGLLLPSNPIASAQLEGTVRPGPNTTVASPLVEWQITLGQTIEVAGQRGRRLAVNDAESEAERRRLRVAADDVTADALRAFYEIQAARATLALADGLAVAMETLAHFTEERAKESLVAPVDARLARAEAVRVGAVRLDAERRLAVARARLEVLVDGDDADAADEAPPTPPEESLAALMGRALLARSELAVAEADRNIADRQASLLRRERIPDVTLSAFTGVNVLGETVVGGSLAVPLPLPAPLGRTHAGDIAEALARRERADATIEQTRRKVRLQVADAFATVRSRAAAMALYAPELTARARGDVQALREGITTHQLSTRDALVSERTLIELLVGEVDARLAYALAWVELRRAVGAEVQR